MLALLPILFCQLQTSHGCQCECENPPFTSEETSGGHVFQLMLRFPLWDGINPMATLVLGLFLPVPLPGDFPQQVSCIWAPTAEAEVTSGATLPAPESSRTAPPPEHCEDEFRRELEDTELPVQVPMGGCFRVGR